MQLHFGHIKANYNSHVLGVNGITKVYGALSSLSECCPEYEMWVGDILNEKVLITLAAAIHQQHKR